MSLSTEGEGTADVSTGRQAHDLDFAVTMAQNACGAASDENHRLGIAAMTRLAQIEKLT